MAEILKLFESVNSLTPLGLAGLIAVLLYLFLAKRGPVQTLTHNHLAHVQASLDRIVDTGDKQLDALADIKADIAYVRGKLD